MKRYIGLLLIIFLAQVLTAQNIVKMSAVKSNDYGVIYILPKTEVVVQAKFSKTTRKAGEFYRFAERYLNVSNPVTKDEVIYKLEGVDAKTRGIPDTENSYLVEFKSNTVAPFVMLTKDGIICAINQEIQLPEDNLFPNVEDGQQVSVMDPKSYLSEEILRAGSTTKQAELIAKQIYRLRESKTNILTGEADNMPPDGEAYRLVMSQIDEQEKALTSMFVGTESVETLTKEFKIMPDKDNIERRIIFRFSSKLGVVASNDLSGEPVYLSLVSRDAVVVNEPVTAKEQKEWDNKYSKGIIYNVPAKASLSIEWDGKRILQKECDVVQFGTKEVLVPKQLEYKKDAAVKIIFYPDLGAVKQIIQ